MWVVSKGLCDDGCPIFCGSLDTSSNIASHLTSVSKNWALIVAGKRNWDVQLNLRSSQGDSSDKPWQELLTSSSLLSWHTQHVNYVSTLQMENVRLHVKCRLMCDGMMCTAASVWKDEELFSMSTAFLWCLQRYKEMSKQYIYVMLLFLKSTLKNYSVLFDPTIETGIWSGDTLAYRMLIVHVKGTNNIFYIKKK